MRGVSYKATQLLSYSIKILILTIAIFFVWKRMSQNTAFVFENFEHIITSLFTYSNISILLLLSIFNWFFEILKWKSLANHCALISTKESVKQVLKAHITSLITPAKIGEYGAKALFFSSHKRKQILFLTLLGNGYQMMVTTIIGSIGIGISIHILFPALTWHYIIALLLGILLLIVTPRILNKIRWSIKGYSLQRIREFMKTIASSSKQKAWFFSLIRYLLFAHQFYFLLTLFQVDVSYLLAMGLITTMYLVSSVIPMLQLFDVVIKTGVAVAVFSWINVPEITIITITFLMWFLNAVLPIIPGSYFILTDTTLVSQKTNAL